MSKFIEVYRNDLKVLINLRHVAYVELTGSGAAEIYVVGQEDSIWINREAWKRISSDFIPDKSEAFEGVDL